MFRGVSCVMACAYWPFLPCRFRFPALLSVLLPFCEENSKDRGCYRPLGSLSLFGISVRTESSSIKEKPERLAVVRAFGSWLRGDYAGP